MSNCLIFSRHNEWSSVQMPIDYAWDLLLLVWLLNSLLEQWDITSKHRYMGTPIWVLYGPMWVLYGSIWVLYGVFSQKAIVSGLSMSPYGHTHIGPDGSHMIQRWKWSPAITKSRKQVKIITSIADFHEFTPIGLALWENHRKYWKSGFKCPNCSFILTHS